jgi:hypothetical protein
MLNESGGPGCIDWGFFQSQSRAHVSFEPVKCEPMADQATGPSLGRPLYTLSWVMQVDGLRDVYLQHAKSL